MNDKENCKKRKGYIMKRFLSILCAFTVLFTSIPINAIAVSEEDKALIESNEIKIDLSKDDIEIIKDDEEDKGNGKDKDKDKEKYYIKNKHDYVIIKLKDEDKNKRIRCSFRTQENSWLDYFVHDDYIAVYSEDKDENIKGLHGLVAVGDKVYYIDEKFNDSADEPAKDLANDPVEPAELRIPVIVPEDKEGQAGQEGLAGDQIDDSVDNSESSTENQGTKSEKQVTSNNSVGQVESEGEQVNSTED